MGATSTPQRRPGRARVALTLALAVNVAVLPSCARTAPPEDVAREYGRSVYANDADALWRLISDADRRVKDLATFRRQQRDLRGVTRDAVRQLAGYMTATPVKTSITADRATVTLRFRTPDANAREIRTLMHDWDENRLEKLSPADHERIAARIAEFHRQGALATIEGDETIELVREAGAWKVFLNWAAGVRVRFVAAVDQAVPLDVMLTPAQVALTPGDRVWVSVKARNTSLRPVTTRVGHRIEPAADSRYLALLQCPLFVPVTLEAAESREFTSEYLLLDDVPKALRSVDVTYLFPSRTAGGAARLTESR